MSDTTGGFIGAAAKKITHGIERARARREVGAED